ncbi:hydrolase [Boudabousia tangfeifanii]|uniref:Hydrolase n=1 Tax=Boudabousia tangfeifanii TaxID=1912795 RepID=A0A1D9MMS5_9ACTO|nr:hydrolase [Boudabousia tangfeifanii]
MDTPTDEQTGLTAEQVEALVAQDRTNDVKRRSSRPLSSIIWANIFTVFNGILTAAAVTVLYFGSPMDALFAIVMVINAATGIIAEIKAKRTLDKVSILDTPTAKVIRDGKTQTIDRVDLVPGDIVCLSLGDQVPTDGYVLASGGLEIDESMLTGESVPVEKKVGDPILSGTAVVSGKGRFQTTAVGSELYVEKITGEVKKFKQAHSELRAGIDTVLRVISIGIIPIVALLIWSQLRTDGAASFDRAIVLAIAGIVGMIPQGLVLLTSVNFAVAAADLARKKVLVQELQAVEVLARVDVLCTDKTGTLTSGGVRPREIITLTSDTKLAEDAKQVLAAMVAAGDNPTAQAVQEALGEQQAATLDEEIPFNSARKWSGAAFANQAWIFGAPEIVLAGAEENNQDALSKVDENAQNGDRVLVLASSEAGLNGNDLPANLSAQLLVVLSEELRPDAKETMEYFAEQGVEVKVISGDNPVTVAALAKRAGIGGGEVQAIDARELPTDPEAFAHEIATHNVFGRVTPEQKRAMVHALQSQDHTVAMTGDGVNDAMALKDADLGIAMGNGAAATKAVAKLVLLNGDFGALPNVVAQGRRIIANMERVSALFFTKTTYAALIAVVVALFMLPYPFLPRHLTIIGSLTIGIPSFFLAMAPNNQRYRPGFLRRTLSLAIPAGVIITAAALSVYLFFEGEAVASTAATVVVVVTALFLLSVLSRPLVWWRIGLLVLMAATAVLIILTRHGRKWFDLHLPTYADWVNIALICVVAAVLIEIVSRIVKKRQAMK